jgi:hypothetical protein
VPRQGKCRTCETQLAAGEQLKFAPWNAQVEHRPLGQIMRARRAAYYTSQLGRGV